MKSIQSTFVLLAIALAGLATTQVQDSLPSWNDGPAKKSVVEFVAKVTTAGSPDFVPVPERVATFDNDGTLWCEHPLPVHRPDGRHRQLVRRHRLGPVWRTPSRPLRLRRALSPLQYRVTLTVKKRLAVQKSTLCAVCPARQPFTGSPSAAARGDDLGRRTSGSVESPTAVCFNKGWIFGVAL